MIKKNIFCVTVLALFFAACSGNSPVSEGPLPDPVKPPDPTPGVQDVNVTVEVKLDDTIAGLLTRQMGVTLSNTPSSAPSNYSWPTAGDLEEWFDVTLADDPADANYGTIGSGSLLFTPSSSGSYNIITVSGATGSGSLSVSLKSGSSNGTRIQTDLNITHLTDAPNNKQYIYDVQPSSTPRVLIVFP